MARPAGSVGDVGQALMSAAHALATPERAPTLRELAAHAQVGLDAANATMKNLSRAGRMQKVRERRVAYRNRPVAEYAPAAAPELESRAGHGWVDLGRCLQGWAR